MNFLEIQKNNDEYELIPLDEINTKSAEVEYSAAKIQNILKKEQFVKYAGCFTVGLVVGDLGSAIISEISAKVYDFVIPTVMREVSLFYAVSSVGAFTIVAIPLIISTYQ